PNPALFKPRGQFEFAAQVLFLLVDEKPGPRGCDFQDMSVRVFKVYRLEIDSIQHLRYRNPSLHELYSPFTLNLIIFHCKCKMMRKAGSEAPGTHPAGRIGEIGNDRAGG